MTLGIPLGPGGSVVTVGSFDGVHVGHLAVLAANVERARAADRRSVLVSFDPHPAAVLAPGSAPPLLTTGAERREILAATGLDTLVLLRFDRELAGVDPTEFVDRVLIGHCGMRELVIGYDHGLGRGRSGDVTALRALARERGFPLTVVDAVHVGGRPVSSSRIRDALGRCDLSAAAELLGRPYSVSGRVERGAGRGRHIGVPTINLGGIPPEKLLPPDGVYAAVVETRTGRHGAMLNQGGRPTFGDGSRGIEAHLFGFDGELYGAWVRVTWIARLREITRFASAEALRWQLERDRHDAAVALAGASDNLQRMTHTLMD